MYEVNIERINLNTNERLEVERFLSTFNLFLDEDVEMTIVLKNKDEILGTCSCSGKVLKCFAVKEGYQGEGMASKLITSMTDYLFDKGVYENFIFTNPKNIDVFQGLGYKKVFQTEDALLLEGGMANIEEYTKNMFKKSSLGEGKKAALVMNCNPFTLGHRYLIERASKENEEVVVFIVEEERSLFPFSVRMNLVKKGIKDLKNVHVLPGGNYMISATTFPSYFIREEDKRALSYAKLDAGIFAKYIAPVFHIEKRYVGTEPYCRTTNAYNQILMDILPKFGIKLNAIERKKIDGRFVSASEVRNLIKHEKIDELKKILPQTTYEFLLSADAQPIIEKIKRSDSAH